MHINKARIFEQKWMIWAIWENSYTFHITLRSLQAYSEMFANFEDETCGPALMTFL